MGLGRTSWRPTRSPVALTRDTKGDVVDIPPSIRPDNPGYHTVESFFGSLHPCAMPSLYANGSVRVLAYSTQR